MTAKAPRAPAAPMDWIRLTYWIAAGSVAVTLWNAPHRWLRARRSGTETRRASYHVANLVAAAIIAAWLLSALHFVPDDLLFPAGAAAWVSPLGLALALPGFAFALWARRRLGRWFVPTAAVLEGQSLEQAGPYAFVRHPFYAGLWWALAWGSLALNSVATLIAAALMAPVLSVLARGEEALLHQHFASTYEDYARRVPRWVPRRRRR